MSYISIVIPVLDEEQNLIKQKKLLSYLIKQGHEIIVVDGGSRDLSMTIAKQIGCQTIATKSSRGYQLHSGALKSNNEILLFLHADTFLPNNAVELICKSLNTSSKHWGRFAIKFSNSSPVFKAIAWFMNIRSSLTGVVTGDHAIFTKRKSYFKCGGFSDFIIMEDISFSNRMKSLSRPICLPEYVVTSSRKWEKQGTLKTIFTMCKLRLLFFIGIPTEKLAKFYY